MLVGIEFLIRETYHVVRDGAIDVSTMKVKGAEHYPSPEGNAQIDLS